MQYLDQLLDWGLQNLHSRQQLSETVERLNQELQQPSLAGSLSFGGKGRLNYLLAAAYIKHGQYHKAKAPFVQAVNLLYSEAELLYEVLTKFISFMEMVNHLEYALMLCQQGLNRFPGDAVLSVREQEIRHKIFEVPYQAVSNLVHWQQVQDQGYFETHFHYQHPDGLISDGSDLSIIARYMTLRPEQTAVVIGCGYGRESAMIAPLVRHLYGIDVTPGILARAKAYLVERGLHNFTPVLAEEWHEMIPEGIDLAYCVTVFQHLTKHLVQDYVTGLADRLSAGGSLICQFMYSNTGAHDAALYAHEPHVTWSQAEIEKLVATAGLELASLERERLPVDEDIFWFWLHARKPLTTN